MCFRYRSTHPLGPRQTSYGVPTTRGWRYPRHQERLISRHPCQTAAALLSKSALIRRSRKLPRRQAARVVPLQLLLRHHRNRFRNNPLHQLDLATSLLDYGKQGFSTWRRIRDHPGPHGMGCCRVPNCCCHRLLETLVTTFLHRGYLYFFVAIRGNQPAAAPCHLVADFTVSCCFYLLTTLLDRAREQQRAGS